MTLRETSIIFRSEPTWPAYAQTRATMEINTECRVVNDPYGAERTMWEKLDL
jgi:carboxylesterase type B